MRGESRARSRPVVAIDGPAGAGKSTVAAHLARRFGLLNLETGAMYRALALKTTQHGVDPDDEAAVLSLVDDTRIALEPQPEGNRVMLDGEVVTSRLREPEVTAVASRVSVHPRVRHWMVEQQRQMGVAGGVVMEGRDIGTVVFPDAEIKIFLDAAAEVRGRRRFRQTGSSATAPGQTPSKSLHDQRSRDQQGQDQESQGQKIGGEPAPEREARVLRELQERDERDRNRAESPLRPAPDAVILDSSELSLYQVLQAAERIVSERFRMVPPR